MIFFYKHFKLISFVAFLSLFSSCDSKKEGNPVEDILYNFLCYSYTVCTEETRGTQFGVIGDSWTDMIGGIHIVWSIRTYMENVYGYKMTGSSLSGRTLKNVLDLGLHYHVINQAGPDLRYMILSLGGNDMLQNYPKYSASLASDKAAVMELIKTRLLNIVRTGNIYKREKWGGNDLVWIIHGYDYPNPDILAVNTEGCRVEYLGYGYPDSLIVEDLRESIDLLNEAYLAATYEEPSLRYVNLRGALGGPPVSLNLHMLDCIHPNSGGFYIISKIFVNNLDYITGNAR
ncbi:MAG: SGNH/GDSL hydrolase family protein [Spirochaetia bacterium]|nr:SGNH/GDSL hydrolase family protein [Spirochaetia bacterium]